MEKQTAVEWLVNEIPVIDWTDPYWKVKFEQAKEMEKEEIIEAYLKGYLEDIPNPSSMQYYEPLAEQYYNETFKQQEQ
jgi:hypothetical protein